MSCRCKRNHLGYVASRDVAYDSYDDPWNVRRDSCLQEVKQLLFIQGKAAFFAGSKLSLYTCVVRFLFNYSTRSFQDSFQGGCHSLHFLPQQRHCEIQQYFLFLCRTSPKKRYSSSLQRKKMLERNIWKLVRLG